MIHQKNNQNSKEPLLEEENRINVDLPFSNHTQLKVDHLGTIEGKNDSKYFVDNLLFFWEQKNYKSIQNNALFKTLQRANIWKILLVLIFSIIMAFLELSSVIIIKEYIDYFQIPEQRKYSLKVLGVALIISRLLSSFLIRQLSILEIFLAYKSSLELSCFVYNKVLKASPSSYGSRSTHGEIINFIQIDAPKISYLITLSPKLLISPLLIITYLYLLFKFVGISFIFGMIVLIICFISSILVRKQQKVLIKKLQEKKDNRMKINIETFESIKLLKFYNWENEFKERVLNAMTQENTILGKMFNVVIFNFSMFWAAPAFSSIVTIGVYQYMNSSINIGSILIGLTIFNMIQPLISDLPLTITNLIETSVSMNRIEEDVNPNVLQEDKNDFAIKIENANFSWGADPKNSNNPDLSKSIKEKSDATRGTINQVNPEEEIKRRVSIFDLDKTQEKPSIANSINGNDSIINLTATDFQKIKHSEINPKLILKNINFEIKKGELIGIIGEVSSGKSSLLQAILNNLILIQNDNQNNQKSSIFLNGTVAYASQISWIQNNTIKNNIVFYGDYDEAKYNKVLQVCQLCHDINELEAGDNTEIGEKGINLSGGQKARIALARAVYSHKNIYLLDDPISALDAHVGKKVMNECILNHLKGSTVLLVTHALQYLKKMDRIIYLSEGEIKWIGTYEELKSSELIEVLNIKLHTEKEKEIKTKDEKAIIENTNQIEQKVPDSNNKNENKQKIKRITTDEEQTNGVVKFSVYLKYLEYMGGVCFCIGIIFSTLLWQFTKAGSDYWLTIWSKKENQDKDEKLIFFIIYASLGVLSCFFTSLRIILLAKGTLNTIPKLHSEMIFKLIRAPINLFHDTTPRGQIYNRLSKDIGTLYNITLILAAFLNCLFFSIGSIVICAIFQPITLTFVPIFTICGYIISKFYLKGSRDLTRLESISRSPLLNTLSETITGAISIRAYKIQNEYLNKFYNQINNIFKINICLNGASNWFGIHMDFVSLAFITFLTIIITIYENEFSTQSVGLILTYSFILKDRLSDFFRICTSFENVMVSVERCLQYTKLEEEKEPKLDYDSQLISENWPKEGKVQFVDYSVQYRPTTEIVLKNLNFTINSKEKIGVVGRTASGKSTMCLCLFRILEPLTGTIKIDDVDITKIGLDLLRQKITIIPQDPSLMKGTLKYNIDPFNKYKEEEIENVINMIGFSSILKQDGLEKMISEGGENLSVGEKQVVCIARAILRKSSIVVMDEATANIDIKTEETIQNAIHLFFRDATVITIAHRIKTIINYDRILVLQNGQVKEFDTPSNLIENRNSMFYELYSKSSL